MPLGRHSLLTALVTASLVLPTGLGFGLNSTGGSTGPLAAVDPGQSPNLARPNVTLPSNATDPPPSGLGQLDPWVDANGDTMFGALTMGAFPIQFASGALDGPSATSGLRFNSVPLCTAGSTIPGCGGNPGDITAVLAGTGLSGGGTSGDVTLAVNFNTVQRRVTGSCGPGSSIATILQAGTVTCEPDDNTVYLAGSGIAISAGVISATLGDTVESSEITDGTIMFQDIGQNGCATGQTLKWTGAAWACADDLASTGTVTSVATGAGLTGGPITSTGTISIAPGGVTSAMIADGTITEADLAFDPVLQEELVAVTGLPPFAATSVAAASPARAFPSIALGWDGLPLVSYYDGAAGDLRAAHCEDIACTSATTSLLDGAGDVGRHTSLTFGPDGLGLISYVDATNGAVKVAHCADRACTSASTSTLATLGGAAPDDASTSITLGSDGLPLVAYYDWVGGDLKVAHCTDAACASSTIGAIASAGDVGRHAYLTLGSDARGRIAYYDATNGDLVVATCSDVPCTSATLSVLQTAGDVGRYPSLALDHDGGYVIAFYDATNQDLRALRCGPTWCFGSSAVVVDSAGDVGASTSVTMGRDGRALIAYYDATNANLKMAHCTDLACNASTRSTVAAAGDVGRDPSITLGTDGLGVVASLDAAGGALSVVHLSNTLGIPYARPR